MDYKAIGQQIRMARKLADMTQDQFAAKCGISASFYGHIERGTRVLSVDTLQRICIALNLSADKLLGILPGEITAREKESILEHINAIKDIIK